MPLRTEATLNHRIIIAVHKKLRHDVDRIGGNSVLALASLLRMIIDSIRITPLVNNTKHLF